MRYDFTSLSPTDFEDLSRDLIQAELGVRLEAFAAGRDSGIDLRFTERSGEQTIVQCKHYVRSGWPTLLSHLNKEIHKVHKIKPRRYILITSVCLSPGNKDTLCELFRPYIRSTDDILGGDDLNNILRRHPKVERSHFKLWLASTQVLERILNGASFARAEETLAELNQQVRLYVSNDSFARAIDILSSHHFCIIAGIPGIGKTLLARMLMLHHLEQQYEAIVVSGDIEEANRLYQPEKHQFFYYDDFLGTAFDETLPKNEDARLIDFLRRVSKAPNKRIVLTTREYILRRATSRYERLAYALEREFKCIIALEDYTKLIRSQIVYNHLYFSNLRPSAIISVCRNNAYMRIVEHKNFSPRLIEYAVRRADDAKANQSEFSDYLVSILERPERLWDHTFRFQLPTGAQAILLSLLFLPYATMLDDLLVASKAVAASRSGVSLSRIDFLALLKQIDGTFVRIDSSRPSHIRVSFLYPGINDYLLSVLDGDPAEIMPLLDHAVFFEQVSSLWSASETRGFGLRAELRYPNIHKWFRAHEQSVCSALKRTYSTESCVWQENWDANSQPRRSVRSAEARCVRIFDIAQSLSSHELLQWTTSQAIELASRWPTPNADLGAVASLLQCIEFSDPIIDLVKDWLLSDLVQADDFGPALDIIENSPDLADETFHEELLERFCEFVKHEYNYIMHDADTSDIVQHSVDEVKQIARKLGIQPRWDVDKIAERVEQLSSPDDDFDPAVTRKAHERSAGVALETDERGRIDHLFGSLARDAQAREENA